MLRTCDEGIIMVYTYQMTVERRVRDEAETERVVKGPATYLGDSSPCSHQVLSNGYVPNTRRGNKVKEQRCKGGNATLDATCDALITCTMPTQYWALATGRPLSKLTFNLDEGSLTHSALRRG